MKITVTDITFEHEDTATIHLEVDGTSRELVYTIDKVPMKTREMLTVLRETEVDEQEIGIEALLKLDRLVSVAYLEPGKLEYPLQLTGLDR